MIKPNLKGSHKQGRGSNLFIDILSQKNKWWMIITLIIITFVSFSPSLKCDFVRWDDHVYVTENEIIKDISIGDLKRFGENVAGNFHPLTMISLALDYHFFELNPFYYHLKNLIFHLLNTALVFFFIMKVSRKNLFVSFFTALLFGIHPMHVESVVWISERKDVLYTFYFLTGLLLYYEYLKQRKILFYILTFISFVLSCLSKSAAVVFPVVLFLIDYYEKEKITLKDLIQKIPLFIVSLVIGIIALKTQSTAGAIEISEHTFWEKIQYSILGLKTYLFKFFVPYKLNNFYPYPELSESIGITIISTCLIVGSIIFAIKYSKRINWLFWGISFALITIVLVLQFLQIGGSFVSERYTYVPYIGIAFVYLMILEKLIKKNIRLRNIIGFMLLLQVLLYSYLTHAQTKVWSNTITLWTNFIEKYPLHSSKAYNYRGDYYLFIGDTVNALADFSSAFNKDNQNINAIIKRSKLYLDRKDYDKAYQDYGQILEYEPQNVDALIGKGAVDYYLGNFDNALLSLNKAIANDSSNYFAYTFRGYVNQNLNLSEQALKDFNKALALNPAYKDALNGKNSIQNINTDRNYEFYTREALNYRNRGNYSEAINSYNRAIELNSNSDDNFYQRALCYVKLNAYQRAVNDLNKAILLNPSFGEYYQARAFMNLKLLQNENAIKDLQKAKELGVDINEALITNLQNQNK